MRNKNIVRIIYFPIIFPDKIDNIKINIYIFWNSAFWKHAREPRRARHMRGNVTHTCVTYWVHPCGLILTCTCVMPRISQTLCFLGYSNPIILNWLLNIILPKRRSSLLPTDLFETSCEVIDPQGWSFAVSTRNYHNVVFKHCFVFWCGYCAMSCA